MNTKKCLMNKAKANFLNNTLLQRLNLSTEIFAQFQAFAYTKRNYDGILSISASFLSQTNVLSYNYEPKLMQSRQLCYL